jgi:flagellar motor switch protein FliM
MSNGGEVLEPEEIDALLKGVDAGALPLGPAAGVPGEARTFDPANPGQLARNRMPALGAINERLARHLKGGLHSLIRSALDVVVRPLKLVKYDEYAQGLAVPTSLNVVRLPPLRGPAILVLDANLVVGAVDRFFGGSGRQVEVAEREFTRTEARIIQMIVKQFSADLREAWAPVAKFDVEHQGSEFNPQFVNVISPSELVVVSTFQVLLDGGEGELQVAMPYSMIEPLREALEAGVQGEPVTHDANWARSLHEEIEEAEIELVPLIGHSEITVGRLLNLKPGDVIPCDFTGSVTLLAEGIPILRGSYGASRGQQSVKVEQHLARNRQTTKSIRQ